eukprot:g81709.t1
MERALALPGTREICCEGFHLSHQLSRRLLSTIEEEIEKEEGEEAREKLEVSKEENPLTSLQQNIYVSMLGVAFLLVYICFGSAKNFLTKLFGKVGSWAMGLLYVVYGISSLVIPAYTGRIGYVKSMVIGATGACLFMLAVLSQSTPLMLVSSAITGLGLALLWNGQALYVTTVGMGADLAKFNGLFSCIYTSYGMVASLILGVMFRMHVSFKLAFSVLLGFGVLGVLLLACLPSTTVASKVAVKSPLKQARDSARMLTEPELAAITPLFLVIGTLPALVSGVLPPLIVNNEVVAFSHLVRSVSTTAGSLVWGHMLTDCGWQAVSVATVLCAAAAGSLSAISLACAPDSFSTSEISLPFFQSELNEGTSRIYFYVAYLFFGLLDAAAHTLVLNALGLAFPATRGAAFGCFRFFSNMVQALVFLCSQLESLSPVHYLVGFVVLSVAAVVSFRFTAIRIDWPEREDNENEQVNRFTAGGLGGWPTADEK